MKRDIDLYFKQNPFPMFQKIPTFISGYFKILSNNLSPFWFQKAVGYQDCPYFCDPCASFVRAAFAAEAKAAEEAAAEAVACVACGGACGAKCEDAWRKSLVGGC